MRNLILAAHSRNEIKPHKAQNSEVRIVSPHCTSLFHPLFLSSGGTPKKLEIIPSRLISIFKISLSHFHQPILSIGIRLAIKVHGEIRRVKLVNVVNELEFLNNSPVPIQLYPFFFLFALFFCSVFCVRGANGVEIPVCEWMKSASSNFSRQHLYRWKLLRRVSLILLIYSFSYREKKAEFCWAD